MLRIITILQILKNEERKMLKVEFKYSNTERWKAVEAAMSSNRRKS